MKAFIKQMVCNKLGSPLLGDQPHAMSLVMINNSLCKLSIAIILSLA
jgi:hypothetical protein